MGLTRDLPLSGAADCSNTDRLYLRNSQEAAAYRLPLQPTNNPAVVKATQL